MIDYQVYSKFHGISEAFQFSTRDQAAYDPWPDTISNKSSLSQTHMMLLPPGIHGFFFKEKKWSKFSFC
jgi:hypothetical protein